MEDERRPSMRLWIIMNEVGDISVKIHTEARLNLPPLPFEHNLRGLSMHFEETGGAVFTVSSDGFDTQGMARQYVVSCR